jgi:hypothetical protein
MSHTNEFNSDLKEFFTQLSCDLPLETCALLDSPAEKYSWKLRSLFPETKAMFGNAMNN